MAPSRTFKFLLQPTGRQRDGLGGTLQAMIVYKAESAGRQVVVVDPRNTSRRCANCGLVDEGNRHGAVFRCLGCGHEVHADINAAQNSLRAGRARQLESLAA